MKKWISAGLILATAAALFGCGKKNEYGIDSSKYVSLGDYKNLTVDVNYYDYTDEEFAQYLDQELKSYIEYYDLYDYVPIKDKKTVSENDLVNIDYIGTLDGVAFDGGTDEGAHLLIGSGSFIDGFEDGLIGVAVGDTVDLNLTFPDDYGNEDLAGKDVVFTVIVNSIDEAVEPEYTEDFFAGYGIENVTNYDEFAAFANDSVEEAKKQQNDSVLEEAIWTKVMGACNVCDVSEFPQELIDQKKSDMDAELKEYADYYGVDTETMLGYFGMDQNSYEEKRQETAEEEARKDLVCLAIADAEGIEVTDDDIKAVVDEYYEAYGYESADGMYEARSDNYLKSFARYHRVMDYLKSCTNVNELETMPMLGDYLY